MGEHVHTCVWPEKLRHDNESIPLWPAIQRKKAVLYIHVHAEPKRNPNPLRRVDIVNLDRTQRTPNQIAQQASGYYHRYRLAESILCCCRPRTPFPVNSSSSHHGTDMAFEHIFFFQSDNFATTYTESISKSEWYLRVMYARSTAMINNCQMQMEAEVVVYECPLKWADGITSNGANFKWIIQVHSFNLTHGPAALFQSFNFLIFCQHKS